MEKKKRQQEVLVKKQKRSAAMQAMLENPGFSGVDATVDVTQEVPAWVMDGGIRFALLRKISGKLKSAMNTLLLRVLILS